MALYSLVKDGNTGETPNTILHFFIRQHRKPRLAKEYMKGYSILPHTADIMIKARGKTYSRLFMNAARGWAEIAGAEGDGGKAFKVTLKLIDANYESLLIRFVNELNYTAVTKNAVIEGLKIRKLNADRLEAEIWGRRNVKDIVFLKEIKAATYHDLKVKRSGNTLNASITLDI
jgi:SHS2 domain-containing protein